MAPSPAPASRSSPPECAVCAGAQRTTATATPSRQTARPASDIRRGRQAASVYSSTAMARSGHGGPERAYPRAAAARLYAEGELRGPEQRDHGERGQRVATSQHHGGRDQRTDRGGRERRAERGDPELARAGGQQERGEQAVRRPQMAAQPGVPVLQHDPSVGLHGPRYPIRTVPAPVMTMTCARKVPVAVQPDFTSISSTVVVSVKPPLMPRYEPVPEPGTTGTGAVTEI